MKSSQRAYYLDTQATGSRAHGPSATDESEVKLQVYRLALQECQVFTAVQCRAVVRHEHDRGATPALELNENRRDLITVAGIDDPAT